MTKKLHLKNFQTFATHEKHGKIRFDDGSKKFKLLVDRSSGREVTLPGLKDFLACVFFPDYEYQRRPGDGSTGVSNIFEGAERGKTVHRELEDYANMPKKDFIKQHPSLHPYSSKAILSMRNWKLKPMCGEVCIWNDLLATSIDNISSNEQGEFVAIEYKTGMDDYWQRGNAPMKAMLQDKFSNCPMNQAFLQLLITCVMIEREYQTTVHDQVVIHIHKSGAMPYRVPKSMIDIRNEIYDYFVNQVNQIKMMNSAVRDKKRKSNRGKRKANNGYIGKRKKRSFKRKPRAKKV